MRPYSTIRSVAFAALAGTSILTAAPLLPNSSGMSSAAQAQPAELGDIHLALEPYGMWQNNPRWGEVWVPFDKGADWRPYTIGHWVYTDDWGWYWISDEDEQDWGWITFHYGRWARDRDLGWFWIPGEEWAPAWVNWRDSEQAVGWAPLPPDDVIDQYDDDPVYWTFVSPRFFVEPEPYRHYYGLGEREGFMRSTIVVNRSLSAGGGRRFGVNPGVSPGRIAFFNRAPVQAFQVRPRVLASTQGIANAVPVQRSQFARRGGAGGPQGGGQGGPGGQRGPRPSSSIAAVSVQRTNATIAPAANLQPQQPLGKGERGRLGGRPPRAAQGDGASPATAPATAPSGRPGAPATTPAPVTTPATTPATPSTSPPGGPRPNGERPSRAIAPQTPPGARPSRAAPNTPPRPATAAPVQPPRPAAPAPQRPKPPKPPVARPAGPPPAAARPVAPRPAVAAPPAARPAPAVARPPAARPAPPPARPAPKPAPKPAAKPGAKPQDVR